MQRSQIYLMSPSQIEITVFAVLEKHALIAQSDGVR